MRSRGSAALQRASLPPADDLRDDDELMQLSAAGRADAYEALVRRHQARVRAYCTRWCGSAALGDELAQECFVELWRRRKSYVEQGRFKPYLFHMAANRCKNLQRAVGRERAFVAVEEEREPPSERWLHERREGLQRGLDRLPEQQREAVLLRYSAELDYAEIASLLGTPEATARSRVFLGLSKLRKHLHREKQGT